MTDPSHTNGPSPTYADLVEQIKAAAAIPPPAFDRVKLTRGQLDLIAGGEPSTCFGLSTVRVPDLPPDMLGFPVDLVDDVEDSTPYQLQQAKLRSAVGDGQCIVACAAADQERVAAAVAGLPGIEVRPVEFLDADDVIVMDNTAREAAHRQNPTSSRTYPWRSP